MVVISEDFVRATSGVGERGELAADLHQSGRNEIGSAAAPLPREALPQSQSDGRCQALASQLGKFSGKLVSFVVFDVQMHRFPYGRNIYIFYMARLLLQVGFKPNGSARSPMTGAGVIRRRKSGGIRLRYSAL